MTTSDELRKLHEAALPQSQGPLTPTGSAAGSDNDSAHEKRMSDERLRELSGRYTKSGNQNSTQRKVGELLDALIAERAEVTRLREQRDALVDAADRIVEHCVLGILDAIDDNREPFDPERDSGCDYNHSCSGCVAFPLVEMLYADEIAHRLAALTEEGKS